MMIKLTAKAIENGGARTITFFFCYLGPGVVKSKSMVTLTTLTDDAIEMIFDERDGFFSASIGAGVGKQVELLTTNDPTVKDALIPVLRSGLCDALMSMTNSHLSNDDVDGAKTEAKSVSWRQRIAKYSVRSVAALALLLLSVGIYYELKPKQDMVAATSGAPDFKDLQEKIKQQITAAAQQGVPATSGIGGQQMDNVALDTMKAMGLDPGKANAGCLVGVK